MIIKPIKFEPPPMVDDPSRSPGVHVSTIVRDIGLQMGYLKPEYANSEPDWARMELGVAWEKHYLPTYHPEIMYQPGEISIQGIHATIDGVSWVESGRKPKVHENKLTWKSMGRAQDLQAEWLWLGQTMTYCVGWETNLAQYHIYWVNGNYKRGTPEGGPQQWMYDLEFTARELKDHMSMILGRARSKHGL